MPELPEVENIKLSLQQYLLGRTIRSVDVKNKKIFQGNLSNLSGARVNSIGRAGKGLLIRLNNGYVLTVHVKMTGQLIYVQYNKRVLGHGGFLPSKHTHVIFYLDNGDTLFYNDIRKFGWVKIVKEVELDKLSFFKTLGPEPLKNLTLSKFKTILEKSSLPIKNLLMDQQKIAGIGNIYANEALFISKINPKRPAKQLSTNEIESLFKAIEQVLKKAIELGGSSPTNYVNASGEKGSYQDHFLVYRKQGQSCPNCGNLLKTEKIGGRGTFFCLTCQK